MYMCIYIYAYVIIYTSFKSSTALLFFLFEKYFPDVYINLRIISKICLYFLYVYVYKYMYKFKSPIALLFFLFEKCFPNKYKKNE
jgi:hypothetical protein